MSQAPKNETAAATMTSFAWCVELAANKDLSRLQFAVLSHSQARQADTRCGNRSTGETGTFEKSSASLARRR